MNSRLIRIARHILYYPYIGHNIGDILWVWNGNKIEEEVEEIGIPGKRTHEDIWGDMNEKYHGRFDVKRGAVSIVPPYKVYNVPEKIMRVLERKYNPKEIYVLDKDSGLLNRMARRFDTIYEKLKEAYYVKPEEIENHMVIMIDPNDVIYAEDFDVEHRELLSDLGVPLTPYQAMGEGWIRVFTYKDDFYASWVGDKQERRLRRILKKVTYPFDMFIEDGTDVQMKFDDFVKFGLRGRRKEKVAGKVEKTKHALVYVNPTPREIIRLLNKSEYDALRWIVDPFYKDLYVWDASGSIHYVVARELAVDYKKQYSGFISKNNGMYVLDSMVHREVRNDILDRLVRDHGFVWHMDEAMKKIGKKIERIDGVEVRVNPTPKEILQFLDKSKSKELRTLCYRKNFYVWDAYDKDHHAILLSIAPYDKMRVNMRGGIFDVSDNFGRKIIVEGPDDCLVKGRLERFLKREKIYYDPYGSL